MKSFDDLKNESLVYIMYNKIMKDRNLKKKGLKDDDNPLLYENCHQIMNDLWMIKMRSYHLSYKKENLNINFFDEDGSKINIFNISQQKIKKYINLSIYP